MNRREFLSVLAAAAAGGLALNSRAALEHADGAALYELPPFGNLSLLHYTDAHAHLLPVWFREPTQNLGLGERLGQPPHLVGERLLQHYGIPPGSRLAYALSSVDFAAAARRCVHKETPHEPVSVIQVRRGAAALFRGILDQRE